MGYPLIKGKFILHKFFLVEKISILSGFNAVWLLFYCMWDKTPHIVVLMKRLLITKKNEKYGYQKRMHGRG